MELGHLPYKKGTYEDYIGNAGLERGGKKKWRRDVADVVARLFAALEPEDTVLGGGNGPSAKGAAAALSRRRKRPCLSRRISTVGVDSGFVEVDHGLPRTDIYPKGQLLLQRSTQGIAMSKLLDIVLLFDVDNTLIDNDRVQADLKEHLEQAYGVATRDRYWEILEKLRNELGYVDYLGALERFRIEAIHRPDVLRMSSWLVDYPFAARLYPGALDAVKHVQQWGTAVILSDGDAVFQPRKVERSGLWRAFDNRVLIYVHKEQELDDVERFYPADHYVLIDDKLRILAAVKKIWGERVTTVFPKQGHYAHDPKILAEFPPADIELTEIGDLIACDLPAFLEKSAAQRGLRY
jgi:FMN phosphatase YigB (HAD superfamily)